MAIGGGGGLIGLIVLVMSLVAGNGGGTLPDAPLGGLDSDLSSDCRTGATTPTSVTTAGS